MTLGTPRPQDCDDANAAIRPGARDVPDNDPDEDFDGVKAVNLDSDGDATSAHATATTPTPPCTAARRTGPTMR